MFVSMIAALALSAGGEGAHAAHAHPEAQPAAAAKPKTVKVCEKVEGPTSTRLQRKVCVTKKVESEKAQAAPPPAAAVDAAAK